MSSPPRRIFRLLVAHFLSRFFRSEHARYEGAARERLSGILAVLTTASPTLFFMLFTVYVFLDGEVKKLWPFGAYFFGLVMIVLGFLAVLVWDDLFPDKVDQAILTAMPIPRSTLMWAKASAVGLLLGASAFALSGLTPLVFASFLQHRGEGAAAFVRLALAYFGSAFLSGILAFGACGALRGATLFLPHWIGVRRASSWIQSGLSFALVSGFAVLPLVADRLPDLVDQGSFTLLAMPPAWFVGLAQVMAGNRDPVFSLLAQVALLATAVSSLLFAWAMSLGFRRFSRLSEDRGAGRGERENDGFTPWIVNRLLLRAPLERATFWFFVATLWRGPRQRMRLLSYLAVAAGWIFIARASGGDTMGQASPIASFLAVAGARSAFGAVCQERANWIIRLTEQAHKARYQSGVRWGVWLTILVPVFLALGLVLSAFGTVPHLGAHLAFHFLAACLLAEGMVVGLPRFPFTTVAGPGHFSDPVLFLLGFLAYVNLIEAAERFGLADIESYAVACGVIATAILAIALLRRYAPSRPFDFQDAPDILAINLAGEEED